MNIEEAKRYAEAIRTINRYEISTPMKDSDRLLQIEGGKPKITCEISPTLLEYAGRCATYLEFIRQLGTLRFTEDGRSAKRIPGEDAKQPLRNDLLLGTTPKIYQQLGFQADPLLYTRRHALKALAPKASKGEQFRHNHGIDPKLMCQVPLLLEDPVLIYNSPNSNSRICVVLNQVDGDKSPLLAVLQPNSKSGLHDGMRYANSNFLITVFGKNNVDSQLRYKVPPSEVLYINKEKSKEIILSIREYEDSVEMPEDERITCLDSDRKVHLIAGNDKAQDFAGYAAECQEYLRFGDDIDLASAGGLERFAYLKISDTPQILLAAGFEQKPMLYTQNHLREALKPKSNNHPHRHGFTIAQIKRWPELFKKPVILADNPSRDDALLVVLCAVDNDKLPLIASIKPDGKGHYELETVETNLVLTVFGKDNFMNYFQGALTPDKIVYIDKKQGQKLERLAERQLFGNYSSLSPNTIIHQPKCIDKIKSAGQQTKEEAQDMDLSGMVNKVRDASEHKRDDNKVSRNEPKHEIDPR